MAQPWSPESPHDHAVLQVLLAVRAFSDAMDRMYGGMKDEMDMNVSDLSALRMLIMREQGGEVVSPHDLANHLRI
jgi:DNA-binding MarR family transcriptional regulator